jgi:hypothetical protein
MLPQIKAKYTARCSGAPSFAKSANGNWQIAVPFEVSQGEHAGEGITWIGVMHGTTDKAGRTGEERVIESLQYMGWQGDDISEIAELSDEGARELLPDEVDLACDVETYDGKTRLKVQWVNRAGAGKFTFKEAASKSDLKSLGAQMKATVRSLRGAAPARPANGKPSAGGAKDDIPFAPLRRCH